MSTGINRVILAPPVAMPNRRELRRIIQADRARSAEFEEECRRFDRLRRSPGG